MFQRIICYGIILVICFGCKKDQGEGEQAVVKSGQKIPATNRNFVQNTINHEAEDTKTIEIIPANWVEITAIETMLRLDLKYATNDNFTEEQIYDCPRCFLRPHVQEKLLAFTKHLQEKHNLGIVIYDCYRPRPYQQKLWDIVPDPKYVTHPDKGSMHTRGMAVDIGLIDHRGNLLDMGTDFDHFGRQSFHSAKDISKEAVINRKLLKEEMGKFGFKPITSEWWHYSYRENIQPLSEWVWDCN